MNTEFLFEFLNLKIFAIIVLIILLLFLAYKEFFKKNKTDVEKDSKEKKDIFKTEIANKDILHETKKDSETDNFLELLELLPDRELEENNEKNIHNSKFLKETFDREFLKNNDTHDSIILSDEVLELAQEAAEKKLGRKVASLIRRVDKNGRIILDMAAINFITGKHSPIIMPDGTIRVLNFLTIEEEIELALNDEKPFFVINRINQIRKISIEDLEKIVIGEEQLLLQKRVSESTSKIEELLKVNKELVEVNSELESKLIKEKDEANKFKSQAEVLFKLYETKNEDASIEKIEDLAQKNITDKILDDALQKVSASKNETIKEVEVIKVNTSIESINEKVDDTKKFVEDFIALNNKDVPKSYKTNVPQKRSSVIADEKNDSALINIEAEIISDSFIEEQDAINLEESEIELIPIIDNETKNKTANTSDSDSKKNSSDDLIPIVEDEIKKELIPVIANEIKNKTVNSSDGDSKKNSSGDLIPIIEDETKIENTKGPDTNKINELIETVNKHESPVEELNVQKKKISSKDMTKISNDVFKLEKYINPRQNSKEIQERIFISFLFEKVSSSYTLNFNKKLFEKELVNYLEQNNFIYTQKDISDIFENQKYKYIKDAYFVSKFHDILYHTDVWQIQVKDENMYGLMLCTIYTEIFTKEELEINLKKVTNVKKVERIKKRMSAILENKFTSI